ASQDDPIEILAIVHPDYRRRGIGRALVGEILLECRRRGQGDVLLVSEEASVCERGFADAMGARYDFSEYRMLLDAGAFQERVRMHSPASFHDAALSDLEALVVIRLASFGGKEAEVRADIPRWLGEANQRLHIAKVNDKPVGIVRVGTYPDSVFINGLGVLPEYRGRGIGRYMLVQVVDRLLQEDQGRILLEVQTDNRDALSLYQSSGFREIATYRYYRLKA
ncbi:MAG: GNAT family N-acetyltransferase, partial [Gammaproteobacteria bacterium]|nr:GNAT family N-acetyltransferase [Gammaproteobacteria bacterium]